MLAGMHRELGQPPIMLVDNWPIVPPMAVIASHQVAEQISKPSNAFPYSAPKSWSLDHAKDLIGHKSILIKQVSDQALEAQTSLIRYRAMNGRRFVGDSILALPRSTS